MEEEEPRPRRSKAWLRERARIANELLAHVTWPLTADDFYAADYYAELMLEELAEGGYY